MTAVVPDELVADTLLELRIQFGAVSCETQTIQGVWTHQNQAFRDDLIRLFVDVSDTREAREFFVGFKDRLRTRFQQLDIWLTTYPIEVL
jgi:hypothetical protein